MYEISHKDLGKKNKMIKLIVENKSGAKVYKYYLIDITLFFETEQLSKALKQYINNSKCSELKSLGYLKWHLSICIDERIFQSIIKRYNNFF